MRLITMFSLAFWLGLGVIVTGCAGLEIGGTAGLYRVDERQSQQATYERNTKPLKCWFVTSPDCGNAREAQGS